MQNQTAIAFLYTCRGLNAGEIQPYTHFGGSDVGLRYHAAAPDGIQRA